MLRFPSTLVRCAREMSCGCPLQKCVEEQCDEAQLFPVDSRGVRHLCQNSKTPVPNTVGNQLEMTCCCVEMWVFFGGFCLFVFFEAVRSLTSFTLWSQYSVPLYISCLRDALSFSQQSAFSDNHGIRFALIFPRRRLRFSGLR